MRNMNKDAEAVISSLLEDCPDMYDAMRKAMEWAYLDSAYVCRNISDLDYSGINEDCAQAIKERAK